MPSIHGILCSDVGLSAGLQERISKHDKHPAPLVSVPTKVQ